MQSIDLKLENYMDSRYAIDRKSVLPEFEDYKQIISRSFY